MTIYNYGLDWELRYAMMGLRGGRGQPVDLRDQVGIYALYKGKELVYIGKSGSGIYPNMIGRIYNHDKYGLKVGKFDRYSWFGFKPVIRGELQDPRHPSRPAEAIRDVEALLLHLQVRRPKYNKAPGEHTHIEWYEQFEQKDSTSPDRRFRYSNPHAGGRVSDAYAARK
jgi:hypothetical protein